MRMFCFCAPRAFVWWSRLALFLASVSATFTLSSCAARCKDVRPVCMETKNNRKQKRLSTVVYIPKGPEAFQRNVFHIAKSQWWHNVIFLGLLKGKCDWHAQQQASTEFNIVQHHCGLNGAHIFLSFKKKKISRDAIISAENMRLFQLIYQRSDHTVIFLHSSLHLF